MATWKKVLTEVDIATGTNLGSSDAVVPSQLAVKTYVDNQVDTEDTISELNDTTIASIADHDLLAYDSGTSKWLNMSPAEAGISTFSFPSDLNADAGGDFTIGNQTDDICTISGQLKTGNKVTVFGAVGGDATLRLTGDDDDTAASRWDLLADHSEGQLVVKRHINNSGTTSILARFDGANDWDFKVGTAEIETIQGPSNLTLKGGQDVIIMIDHDEDTSAHTSQFEVQDHDANILFKVAETGAVESSGGIVAGGDITAGTNTLLAANIQATAGTIKVKTGVGATTFEAQNDGDLIIAGDFTASGNNIKSASGTVFSFSGVNTAMAGNLTVNGTGTSSVGGNFTVGGDLTVTGTTITTATETIEIADNTLVLNSDNAGGSVDSGFVVQMGTGNDNNPSLWYDCLASSADTTGRWVVGSTDDASTAIGGYVADVMQVRIDNAAINTNSTEVPVGHMQYHNGELYLRVED